MTMRDALCEAAELLESGAANPVDTDELERRAAAVEAGHPGVRVDLVWSREAADARARCRLLLRSETGTFSLGFQGAPRLPWPLIGAQRWDDRTLVEVDGERLLVSQAVTVLDFVWREAPLADRLIDICLIRRALREHRIELSEDEVQRAIDAFRIDRGLASIADTEAWLQRNGLSEYALEQLATEVALVAKLRDHVVGAEVEPHFAHDRAAYDRIRCAILPVGAVSRAQAIADAARAGAPFAQLVEGELADRPGSVHHGWHARHALGDLGDIALVVGAVVVRRQPPAAVLLQAIKPAVLDAVTREAIADRLFARWLAERRAAATIEWKWGLHAERSR